LDTTLVVREGRHLPPHNLLVNSNHRRSTPICNITYTRKEVARLCSNQNSQWNVSGTRIHVNINTDRYTKPREFQDVTTQEKKLVDPQKENIL